VLCAYFIFTPFIYIINYIFHFFLKRKNSYIFILVKLHKEGLQIKFSYNNNIPVKRPSEFYVFVVAAHHVCRFCLRYHDTLHLLEFDAISCIISQMKSDCFVCLISFSLVFR
jgi:hypothetical protein